MVGTVDVFALLDVLVGLVHVAVGDTLVVDTLVVDMLTTFFGTFDTLVTVAVLVALVDVLPAVVIGFSAVEDMVWPVRWSSEDVQSIGVKSDGIAFLYIKM